MRYQILSTLASLTSIASALNSEGWRTQSIYQVITDRFAQTDTSTTAPCDVSNYCGGTYQGLINKLDYIQNMGFTAVWISPVVKNLEGGTAYGSAYHGYWTQDIYNINTNFGPASDLVALSAALHQRGMYLMIDVVTNHFAQATSRAYFDFTALAAPFNDATKFHMPCDIDDSNQASIEQCWQGDNTIALADVRTEDISIQDIWNSWLADMIKNYTIDGLRIDSAKHVDPGSIQSLQLSTSPTKDINNATHVLGEVFSGDPTYLCGYQTYMTGLMNYPTFYWITQAFQSTTGSIANLVDGINTLKSTCPDVGLLGAFLENHDNPRFPSLTSDQSLIKNAVTFAMLQDGIPIVYQGQEQTFYGGSVPYNREALWSSGYSTSSSTTLYPFIATLNKIRSWAIAKDAAYIRYNAWPIWNDDRTMVMRKGNPNAQIIGVFTNRGAAATTATITVAAANSGLTSYQQVVDVVSCRECFADSNGNLGVTIVGGMPRVLYPVGGLKGSGICGQ